LSVRRAAPSSTMYAFMATSERQGPSGADATLAPAAMTSQLTLRTILVVREHASGDVSMYPLADPTLVSHGPEATCLVEQRVFLTEHLARAAPEIVARYA